MKFCGSGEEGLCPVPAKLWSTCTICQVGSLSKPPRLHLNVELVARKRKSHGFCIHTNKPPRSGWQSVQCTALHCLAGRIQGKSPNNIRRHSAVGRAAACKNLGLGKTLLSCSDSLIAILMLEMPSKLVGDFYFLHCSFLLGFKSISRQLSILWKYWQSGKPDVAENLTSWLDDHLYSPYHSTARLLWPDISKHLAAPCKLYVMLGRLTHCGTWLSWQGQKHTLLSNLVLSGAGTVIEHSN